MKLSFVLQAAGFVATSLDTRAIVTLENGTIPAILLECEAQVPGLDNDKFQEFAADAKANCPVSKLLNTEISLSASLK
jgi:osmotically inducible protein OsmC